jgi:DNA-binding LacI/PurR family transcriptional regulator
LSYNPEYVRIADFTEESGYIAMQELLALENPPTAVFAGNDLIAYGAYRAARDMDLNIPGDISIVGFDDDYLSRYLNPPLTTMNLPAAGLGSIAAGLVAQLIAVAGRRSGTTGTKSVIPGASVHQTILPTRISVRSSCRRL